MIISFFNTQSDINVMNKSLNPVAGLGDINCIVKGQIDVENPEVLIDYNDSVYTANYFFIDAFHRYYNMRDPELLPGRKMLITGKSDVLMSFRNEIPKCKIICERNENNYNAYYNDEQLPIVAPPQRKMFFFPDAPLSGGHDFIMIVGGAV